jgi:hypothetical protein
VHGTDGGYAENFTSTDDSAVGIRSSEVGNVEAISNNR